MIMRNNEKWEEKECLQCGKHFLVRKCYTKRGQGKFCSTSCGTTYRNIIDNPSKSESTRIKISANHADVSGVNNPMYGRKGSNAPSYIDGRNSILGYKGGDIWRKIALINKPHICEICGEKASGKRLHIHHKDKNHSNNSLDNLMVVCVNCHNNVIHKRLRDDLGRFTSLEVM